MRYFQVVVNKKTVFCLMLSNFLYNSRGGDGGNKANAVDLIVGRVVSASAEFTRRQSPKLASSCEKNSHVIFSLPFPLIICFTYMKLPEYRFP